MPLGGAAWRGWFPPGGELTAGVPDGKEGIYFGARTRPDHPRVRAGTPLHGANLFPARPAELASRSCSRCSTGSPTSASRSWSGSRSVSASSALVRAPHRRPDHPVPHLPLPAGRRGPGRGWGVQEHTDYGLLTLLRQDDVGGLEVRTPDGWVEAPPVPDSFVCNLGDMLERMTGGTYRSTPHRVRRPPRGRVSFPFFLDPSWDARIVPVPGFGDTGAPAPARWDGRSVFDFEGTYGDYLSAKVAAVFPGQADALRPARPQDPKGS